MKFKRFISIACAAVMLSCSAFAVEEDYLNSIAKEQSYFLTETHLIDSPYSDDFDNLTSSTVYEDDDKVLFTFSCKGKKNSYYGAST
ncbi:MAG: hypothetical protein ACI4JX_01495, partial [Oscillospiraceae bacterium]